MRLALVCLGLFVLIGYSPRSGAAPDRLGDISITEDGQRGTKDCGGAAASVLSNKNKLTFTNCKTVTLQGNKNKVTLKGCAKLEVPGNNNMVNAGLVKSISTLGNKNTVLYKLGPKKKKPSINNPGTGNKIRAVK
jgi:hypothetical protein